LRALCFVLGHDVLGTKCLIDFNSCLRCKPIATALQYRLLHRNISLVYWPVPVGDAVA